MRHNDATIFKVAATAKGKVELTLEVWVMLRVHPNDVKKFSLYKSIESKIVLDAAFRMRQCSIAEIPTQTRTFDWRLGVRTAPDKPRHVLIAFLSDRSGNQDKNPSLFDHLSATQVTTYPARDVIADFKKHRYVEYYKMFTEFARDYYGLEPLTVDIIKEEFPVFYFDVSKQSEQVIQSVMDIKI